MSLRSWVRRIREYGLPLLLSLVLLEAGVRIADPSGISDLADQRRLWRDFVRFDQDPVGKTMPPDADLALSGWSIRTNRFGFRDEDFTESKPPEQTRVLLLGDSYLFGHGVVQSQLFPTLMEDSLGAEQGGSWQLINTGLGSYATHEEWAHARLWAERLDVDAIVLLYTFNDADPRFVRVSPRHDPVAQVPTSAVRPARSHDTGGWKDRLRDRHALYRAALWLWPRTLDFITWMRKSQAQALDSTSPVRFDDSNWAWRLSRESLREIHRLSLAAGIPFVVLYLNDYTASSPAPIARANGDALREFCRGEGIPYQDLRPRLMEQQLHEHRNSRVDGHPDATGHEILAGVLLDTLFGKSGHLEELTVTPPDTTGPR